MHPFGTLNRFVAFSLIWYLLLSLRFPLWLRMDGSNECELQRFFVVIVAICVLLFCLFLFFYFFFASSSPWLVCACHWRMTFDANFKLSTSMYSFLNFSSVAGLFFFFLSLRRSLGMCIHNEYSNRSNWTFWEFIIKLQIKQFKS